MERSEPESVEEYGEIDRKQCCKEETRDYNSMSRAEAIALRAFSREYDVDCVERIVE